MHRASGIYLGMVSVTIALEIIDDQKSYVNPQRIFFRKVLRKLGRTYKKECLAVTLSA